MPVNTAHLAVRNIYTQINVSERTTANFSNQPIFSVY